ncbi:sugar ABC transporter ATP-binding protein [Romboutsia weinsteinii]|nr:sugar ABC transporter ATP-binding protein [Romboutsia weinsteinii]
MIKTINLSKKFSGIYALKDINFHLRKGEVHGIVGANGSGKSTFLNILFQDLNIHKTGGYEGDIIYEGTKLKINNTREAMELGIGKVYQEFALINSMDIASNIKINSPNIISTTSVLGDNLSYINKKENEKEAQDIISEFRLNIDAKTYVEGLMVNTKQFIEIAREVSNKNLKVLLLDEPTASLNKEDVDIFINIIEKLKKNGVSIIFISHRLDEITHLCDRVSVFRDGEIVAKYSKEEFDVEQIAIDMIGKKVNKALNIHRDNKNTNQEDILRFDNVAILDGNHNIKDINLSIKRGEILGITSLAGHGHTSLSYSIMGLLETNGDIIYRNKKLNIKRPDKTIEQGIVMIPDERKERGILLDSSVRENIIFTSCYSKNNFLKIKRLKGLSLLDFAKIKNQVNYSIKEFNIKCSSPKQKLRELSGGNQQKICIARAVLTYPDILFINEPTRGIDIYSKEIILDSLLKINKANETTIILASSEIDELKRVCDRIIVMYEGSIFDILSPYESNEVFSLAISGKRRNYNEKN